MSQPKSRRPTVLVTGAAGLIGSRLLNALSPDYDTVAFDIVKPNEPQPATDWIKCDLTEDDFSGEPSPLYQQLTVRGTQRLLRELQAFDVEQFVFSSSLLVMRPAEVGMVLTEGSPTQAEWDYP